MGSFTYEPLPVRIVFGVDAVSRLRQEVDRLDLRRVLIIGEDELDTVRHPLRDIVAGEVQRIEPHVPVERVEEVRELAAGVGADGALPVGGGSAIGLAKALALSSGLPIVAVATTYSGSEMTPIYGMTDGGTKRTGRDLAVLPKTVIYDPALTTGLPPAVTAGSGMNAIAHCVEALYARNTSPVVRALAAEGIRALVRGLPRAVKNPDDVGARSDCLLGSHMAGSALATAGMAIHHRICHVLGGMSRAPHGDLNAVILPHVLAYNARGAPEAIRQVARLLDSSDAGASIQDFAGTIGAPTSLGELGLAEDTLPEAAASVLDGSPWNPVEPTPEEILDLLLDAFRGSRPRRWEPA